MSLREALGTNKLVMLIIAFFALPEFLIIGFMYLSGSSESSLVVVGLSWLMLGSFLAYGAMTIKFDNAVTERTVRISAPIDRISEVVPQIITENRWKLAEVDQHAGRYKVRLGMTFQTWAQIMLIHLSRIDEISTKVDLRCETLGQSYDRGSNAAVIERFCAQLEKTLQFRV